MKIDLGKIQRLSLKEVWPGEQTHFTPWLSQNLDALGEVIGIEMECLDIELQAGDGQRHADMLVEISNGEVVVIENQYGKADPSHGWRTMHYSLALGAKTAIWIFEDISADDERLISFINSNTTDLNIIGIRAEVCKIDNSLPAVNFSVIPASQEALQNLKMKSRSSRNVTPNELFYGNYFPELIARIQEISPTTRGGYSANKGHWNYYCSWNSFLGSRNPWEAAFNQRRGGQGYYYVHLMLRDGDAKKNFDYLQSHQEELTKDLHEDIKIVWDFDSKRKSQKIKFIHPMTNIEVVELTRSQQQELIDWTCQIIPQLQDNLSALVHKRVIPSLSVASSR